jgi:hypothetical protein
VVARPLIAQRPLDENEIRRVRFRNDPSGRGHAHEEPTARSEQLLGHQDRERRTDRTTDDSDLPVTDIEPVQVGVIPRPRSVFFGVIRGDEVSDDVPVRIEYTDLGDGTVRQFLLPPCLVEE